MNELLSTLRTVLAQTIEDIDTDHSYLTVEQIYAALKLFQKEEYKTKYQATKHLNGMSRSNFDLLVARGELPKGEKLYAGDTNLFWRKSDLDDYKKKHSKR